MQSCFRDDKQRVVEINFQGAVAQQLNFQFQVDALRARKQLYHKYLNINKLTHSSKEAKAAQNKRVLAGMTERR